LRLGCLLLLDRSASRQSNGECDDNPSGRTAGAHQAHLPFFGVTYAGRFADCGAGVVFRSNPHRHRGGLERLRSMAAE
jgi:hypothetical protein